MEACDHIERFVFRMIHYSNLDFILKNGIYARNGSIKDANYVNIGDVNLIQQRQVYVVGINPPGGFLGDYVPFYFGGHSPMLLNIITGYRGVELKPQDEIIYLVCKIKDVIANCADWCFTDGHPKDKLTESFSKIEDLDKVDWHVVREQFWRNTEDDLDRMRRKQAEFLVKEHVPVECISAIIVESYKRQQEVIDIVSRNNFRIQVHVDINNQYFYP